MGTPFKMKGMSFGNSPMKQGDQPHTKEKSEEVERKKGLLEDRIDLTTQNKKKIAEFTKAWKAGNMTTEEYREAVAEIKTYVNPE